MAINFPANPSNGDVHAGFTYNSTKSVWEANSPSMMATSDTAPTSPSDGQMWFDTDGGGTFVYYEDADSSQWVEVIGSQGSPGAAGAAGADGGAGVASVYATVNDLPTSGNSQGDMAHVTANNTLYFWNGSGWYKIALINANPSISGVSSSYDLATDGTATTVTITASDPEGLPITYSIESDTSGSIATVTQGTGASSNVFTITPSTLEANAGTFSLTFRASDGVNIATAPASFELAFRVVNSNYTTALLTSVGANLDVNNSFVDSSTNAHTLTVGGNATQSTFSPYRSGGYSTYFDGSGDYLRADTALDGLTSGSSPWTIDFWIYPLHNIQSAGAVPIGINSVSSGANIFLWRGVDVYYNNSTTSTTGSLAQNTWTYIQLIYDGTDLKVYHDGSLQATITVSFSTAFADCVLGIATEFDAGSGGTPGNYFYGYIRDFRVTEGALTAATSAPIESVNLETNTTLLTCHLPYLADSSTNETAVTVYGNTSVRAFGPYDTKKYSSGVHGGSMYLDGSGDSVRTSTDASLTMGSGDFTIEGWFYNSSTAAYQFIFDGRNGEGNSADNIYLYTVNGTSLNLGFASTNDASVTNISQNTWYHFALVRSGSGTNNVQLYLNGKSVYNLSSTQDFSTTTKMTIGDRFTLNNGFSGNISNFRVVKGTAVYTSAFTPPTAPLTAISNTSLLVNGTSAGIIDKAQRTQNILLSGNTSSSTTQTKYLTSSIYLDGTSDYIDLYSDNIANFGTGDFTIELWAYYNSIPEKIYLLETRNGTNSTTNCWSLSHNWMNNTQNDKLQFAATSAGDLLTANTAMPTGQWVHIAVTRNGTSLKMFFDGVEVASATNSYDFNQNQNPIRVGARFSTQYFFDGYLSDIRITKGLARYTTAFTPPTAALQG